MTRRGYVMEPRARVELAHPKPPPDGRCEECGHWAAYLTVTYPDTRWRCAPCARPLEGAYFG